jgi:hypothetical protein
MMLPDPSTRGLGHAAGARGPTVCVGAWHGYRPAVPTNVPPAASTGVPPAVPPGLPPAAPRREPFERTEKGTW